MYSLMVFFGIAFLICWKISNRKDFFDEARWALRIMGPILSTLVFSLVILVFCVGFSQFVKYEFKEYSRWKLVAMSSTSHVSGSFFLGSGTIGEKEKYIFFVKFNDGSIKKRLSGIHNAYIFEDSKPENAKLIIYKKHSIGNLAKWLFPMEAGMIMKEFHIPPGSITQIYKLN